MAKSIIEALTQNSPLALLVIGIFLVIMGAAGGWPNPSLQVYEPGWRIVLAALGVIVAGVGGLLVWRGNSHKEVSASGRKYGVKIVSPIEGLVETRVDVVGTYKKKPPNESLTLLEFSHQSQRYHFFPKIEIRFSEEHRRWSSVINLGGNPGQARDIVVAVLGKGGKALSEYYNYIEEQTKQRHGIKTLTPDIAECHRITVLRK